MLILSIFCLCWTTPTHAGWISIGPDGGDIYALAIDPSTPQTIYAGTYDDGVFKSTNGGTSWTPITSGLTETYIYSLAINPKAPQTIYAGAGGGIFKSTNGGTSWTQVSSGLTSNIVYSLAINPSNPQIVYAGSRGDGVFKSTNGGLEK